MYLVNITSYGDILDRQWFETYKEAMAWGRLRASVAEHWGFDIYKEQLATNEELAESMAHEEAFNSNWASNKGNMI